MELCAAIIKKYQKWKIAGYVFLAVLLLGIYKYELNDISDINTFEENKQHIELISDRLPKKSSNGSTNSQCQKKHNIFFRKEYKCASTTVTNILLRFADSNNLSVAIPPGLVFYKENALDQIPKQYRTPDDKYNIFCFHWHFNRTLAKRIVYKDAIYISVLRDPVAKYVSAYYFQNQKRLKLEDILPVDQHVKQLVSRFDGITIPQKSGNTFGFEIPENNLAEYLQRLNSIFHLVMIVEFLDESLILLKHELCWGMTDIVYIRSKVSPKTHNDTKLSNQSYTFLNQYLKNQKIVYRYFLEGFQEKIKLFGKERMKEEVANLRSQCSFWQHYCISKEMTYESILTEEGKNHPFCQQLILNEDREAIKQKQKLLLKSGYKFPS